MHTAKTFWSFPKIADTAAQNKHDKQWRLFSDDCLGQLVADFWRDRLPQAYSGLGSGNKPRPVGRESAWLLLGDSKPAAFRDQHGKYPDWEKLAGVSPEDYGDGTPDRGLRNTNVASLRLTEPDALEWIEKHHPPKQRVGAPEKYDWDSFWRQVALIGHSLDGLPEKQSELEKAMEIWCEDNWNGCPSISKIREKISPLYPLPR